MSQRGELIERSFAHTLETGSLRRVHLRGCNNILKRMLIHLCASQLDRNVIPIRISARGSHGGQPDSGEPLTTTPEPLEGRIVTVVSWSPATLTWSASEVTIKRRRWRS